MRFILFRHVFHRPPLTPSPRHPRRRHGKNQHRPTCREVPVAFFFLVPWANTKHSPRQTSASAALLFCLHTPKCTSSRTVSDHLTIHLCLLWSIHDLIKSTPSMFPSLFVENPHYNANPALCHILRGKCLTLSQTPHTCRTFQSPSSTLALKSTYPSHTECLSNELYTGDPSNPVYKRNGRA